MKRYNEEFVYKYLDQSLSTKELKEFKEALENSPELREMVTDARNAHQAFSENSMEQAPEKFSDQVMNRVKTSSSMNYYRPSGLFSNSGFLLVSGVLTALVALLSVINGGYIDVQSISTSAIEMEMVTDNALWHTLTRENVIANAMLVLYGILGLVVLDRFVFHPFFLGRVKQVGLR